MDAPRQVKFHESANRHNLIMGGEREWVLVTAFLALMLIVMIRTWWSVALGLCLWFGGIAALKRMGKADPIMVRLWRRSLLYKDRYEARSGIDVPGRSTPKTW
jgi:type IV secretion system protein VirB3